MRASTLAALGVILFAVVAVAPAGCTLDRFGHPGEGAGGAGGAGGGPPVCDHCPGNDTTCHYRTCEDECGFADAAAGTACTEDSGAVCDGEGSCVQCNSPTHCPRGDLCQSHKCVPATCLNGELDPGETDTDCGGPKCGPCENNKGCTHDTDCLSNFCNADFCAPCVDQLNCAAGEFCDNGACVPQKPLGDPCSDPVECLAGQCAHEVCCDSGCSEPCESCLAADTGLANGTCGSAFEGGSCGMNGCSGDSGSVVQCSGGICASAQNCSPYVCVNGSCTQDCQGGCADNAWCNGSSCQPKKNNGSSCVDPGECLSNECADGVCCDNACGGCCESCLNANTGMLDGHCDYTLSGTNPDGECGGAHNCNGMGHCSGSGC